MGGEIGDEVLFTKAEMRQFETGATRNVDATKPDYEGFLSPLTLLAFARYMNKNRVQADGKLRDSDNWQKGIPLNSYMKSLLRHVMDMWLHHRGYPGRASESLDDALAGVLFNVAGYTHETEKAKLRSSPMLGLGVKANVPVYNAPHARAEQMDPKSTAHERAYGGMGPMPRERERCSDPVEDYPADHPVKGDLGSVPL